MRICRFEDLKIRRYTVLLVLFVWACACAYAQTDTIRYVRTTGAYNNDGRSWANAKNRVQDAINDLKEYLADNHLTSGSVYIAAGTYVPTESTESSGGSMLNTSFKIYAGIHVYGGFNPDDPEEKPGDRIMAKGFSIQDHSDRKPLLYASYLYLRLHPRKIHDRVCCELVPRRLVRYQRHLADNR